MISGLNRTAFDLAGGVPGTPYVTAWANSGKSGRVRREQGGERGQPRYLCARKWVAPSAPGHESRVRDSRGRPAVLVRWLMRSWREILLKKISTRVDRCKFRPRRPDHTEKVHRPTGADSNHRGDDFEPRRTPRTRRRRTQETQSRRKRKSRMGTDRIRRLRHGASACVRRLSAPGRLCWSQLSGASSQARRTLPATS